MTAGSCVSMMRDVEDEEDAETISMIAEDNWNTLFGCEKVSRCKYADVLLKSDNGEDRLVECKFGSDSEGMPAGNVGLEGSPLYPNYYVGNSLIPTKGEPPHMYDDNQSKNYFGSIYSDIIRSLI
jgi:hypothetical protein